MRACTQWRSCGGNALSGATCSCGVSTPDTPCRGSAVSRPAGARHSEHLISSLYHAVNHVQKPDKHGGQGRHRSCHTNQWQ